MKFKKLLTILLATSMLFQIPAYVNAEEENDLFADVAIPAYLDTTDNQVSMSEKQIIGLSKYSDVPEGELLDKIHFLETMGIVAGFDDGTFRPQSHLTRGECALIIMRALGESAQSALGDYFYDVSKTHIFADEINTMAKAGIVVGYNGAFRPDDAISGQEFLTMAVRALYRDSLSTISQQPIDYYSLANKANLLDGVVFKNGMIDRENLVEMVCNLLEAPLFSVQYNRGEYIYRQEKGVNILSERYNIYKAEGVIYANEISSLVGRKMPKGQILIGGNTYYINTSVFNDCFGYLVDYYYCEPRGDEATVVFISKSKKCKTKTIKAEDFLEYKGGKIFYDEGNRIKSEQLADAFDVVYNGSCLDTFDSNVFDIPNGTIKLIGNEGANSYNVAIIETFVNFPLSTLTSKDMTLVFKGKYDVPDLEVDLTNDNIIFELYDGKLERMEAQITIETTYNADGIPVTSISLPPVPDDSLLSIVSSKFETSGKYTIPSASSEYFKVIVNDKKVTGAISGSYSDDREYVEISDEDFGVSAFNFFDELGNTLTLDKAGTFMLDADGYIADYVSGDSTAQEGDWEYVYMYNMKYSEEDELLNIRFLNTTGKCEKLICTGKVKINDKSYKEMSEAADTLSTAATYTNTVGGDAQLLKIKRGVNGNITNIQTCLQPIGLPTGAEKDHLKRDLAMTDIKLKETFGWGVRAESINGGTPIYGTPGVIFVVPKSNTTDEKAYSVMIPKEWGNDKTRSGEVYDADRYRIPKVVINYAEVEAMRLQDTFYMVDSYYQAIDEDNDIVTKLSVCNGNKMEELNVKDDSILTVKYKVDGEEVSRKLKKGDLVFLSGTSDEVTKIDLKYAVDNLPSLNTYKRESGSQCICDFHANDGWTYTFAELWGRSNRWLVLQAGALTGKENARDVQRSCLWTTNTAVLKEGVMVYDNTGASPEVRVATLNDLREACKFGNEKSTKAFVVERYNDLRQMVLYNME